MWDSRGPGGKIMQKLGLMILAALVLASCAATKQEDQQLGAQYVGKNVDVSAAQFGPPSAFAQEFSPEQRAWLDDSCPRSLGPSLWRSCMNREGAALASPSNSQLNHLAERQKRWLAQACPHSIGPSLHRRCVERETTALVAPGWPDVDTLPTDQRNWLLKSCPSSLGPSLWRRCAEREMAALRRG